MSQIGWRACEYDLQFHAKITEKFRFLSSIRAWSILIFLADCKLGTRASWMKISNRATHRIYASVCHFLLTQDVNVNVKMSESNRQELLIFPGSPGPSALVIEFIIS